MVEDESVLKWYNWTLTRNFAIKSGVIQVNNNGYFEIYNSTLSNNHAFSISISEIFVSATKSIINDCTIFDNTAFSKEQIVSEISESWLDLWYFSDEYKQYLINNTNLMDTRSMLNSFDIISSEFEISNHTSITNQPNFLSSFLSTISLNDLVIYNTSLSSNMLTVSESTININVLNITQISADSSIPAILSLSGTNIVSNDISYTNSSAKFITSVSSSNNLTGLTINDVNVTSLIFEMLSATNVTFGSITIDQVATGNDGVFKMDSWYVHSIVRLTMTFLSSAPFIIRNTQIKTIDTLQIGNTPLSTEFINSDVGMIKNSSVLLCGRPTGTYGSAIVIKNSNVTIVDSIFDSNSAVNGGAISIQWTIFDDWVVNILSNTFIHNQALKNGGAIIYDFRRPAMENNSYENNTAEYGNNIASYAAKIVERTTMTTIIELSNIGTY